MSDEDIRPRYFRPISKAGGIVRWVLIVAAVLVVVVGIGYISFVGLAAGDSAQSTLRKAGFENIQLGGPAPLRCGDEDSLSNTFTATNPRGERVSGVVCCGLGTGCGGKACTIRF